MEKYFVEENFMEVTYGIEFMFFSDLVSLTILCGKLIAMKRLEIYYILHITYCILHITYYILPIPYYILHIIYVSYITYHLSHITYHISQIIYPPWRSG